MVKIVQRVLILASCLVSQSSAFTSPSSLAQPLIAVRALHAHNRRDWLVNAGIMGIVAAGFAGPAQAASSPIVFGDESLMAPKAHGTTATAVQVGTFMSWNLACLVTSRFPPVRKQSHCSEQCFSRQFLSLYTILDPP